MTITFAFLWQGHHHVFAWNVLGNEQGFSNINIIGISFSMHHKFTCHKTKTIKMRCSVILITLFASHGTAPLSRNSN